MIHFLWQRKSGPEHTAESCQHEIVPQQLAGGSGSGTLPPLYVGMRGWPSQHCLYPEALKSGLCCMSVMIVEAVFQHQMP